MAFSFWKKQKRVWKRLDGQADLSLEEAITVKLQHFLTQLGNHDVTGLRKVVLAQVERPLVKLALEWAKGNQLKAARLLGINRNTLRRKMRDLRIQK